MAEYWNVIDYPGYAASDDGKVYKILPSGDLEELEQHMDEFGYASVYLKNTAGVVCEKPVARIIATLFSKHVWILKKMEKSKRTPGIR